MKRFIKIMVCFVLFVLVVSVLPAVIIDPYNVLHWKNIRDNGVEPNKAYIKTKYIINNPNKFDAYLFGSSRVSAIHTNLITDEKVYNMTCSEGVPADHLDTIKTFLENGVTIKKIYIGVDSLSYTIDPKLHNTTPLRCHYSFLHNNFEGYFNIFCNPWINFYSLKTTIEHGNHVSYVHDEFYEYGWHCDYDVKSKIDWKKAKPVLGGAFLIDETISDIVEIKKLCKENNIELVVFTNPMCEITYKESVNHDYFEFLQKLAEVTDYYNFSGLSDITLNNSNFYDASHYTAYIGDDILDVIAFNKTDNRLLQQGFGMYISKDNVADLIELLEKQL